VESPAFKYFMSCPSNRRHKAKDQDTGRFFRGLHPPFSFECKTSREPRRYFIHPPFGVGGLVVVPDTTGIGAKSKATFILTGFFQSFPPHDRSIYY